MMISVDWTVRTSLTTTGGPQGHLIKTTPEHLAAHVDEQVFRFNNRKATEWERFNRAIRLIVGKRLTYSTLTDGAIR